MFKSFILAFRLNSLIKVKSKNEKKLKNVDELSRFPLKAIFSHLKGIMRKHKSTKIDSYENKPAPPKEKSTRIKRAAMTIIEELDIKHGSFKFYVHDGTPGEKVEILKKVLTDL